MEGPEITFLPQISHLVMIHGTCTARTSLIITGCSTELAKKGVCYFSQVKRGGGFFPLLDSMHVKYLVEIFKDKNYDQHNMLRKLSEPDLFCHVSTVLP